MGRKPPMSVGKKEFSAQLSSPKWDGTPTPSVLVAAVSPSLKDDEVLLNLVFNTIPRSSSKPSFKSKKGTKKESLTCGKAKRSMNEILQGSRQNTLKRCRLL
ncbi:hypothetical protein HAX54_029301 [Datura stramonium]|uniref:Uncharacterized protein n=1 Tax=Datura stramonium TaxID=4076 RepID=A0ABS8V8Z0_DATST|nr:hypothetical protein [Datura stramonium]